MNRCINHSRVKSWLGATAALLLAACASHVQKPEAPTPAPAAAATAPAAQLPDKGDPEQRFQAALQLMKDKKPQDAKDAFAKLAQAPRTILPGAGSASCTGKTAITAAPNRPI